jgi:Cd2+/Zn2+-exporting ATPase
MKPLPENHPKDKRPGAILFAGTLNKMVLLKWKLLPSIDTTFAKIIRLTFEAALSDTQKFIQRFSKFYTPSIITMAVLVLPYRFCFASGL